MGPPLPLGVGPEKVSLPYCKTEVSCVLDSVFKALEISIAAEPTEYSGQEIGQREVSIPISPEIRKMMLAAND